MSIAVAMMRGFGGGLVGSEGGKGDWYRCCLLRALGKVSRWICGGDGTTLTERRGLGMLSWDSVWRER